MSTELFFVTNELNQLLLSCNENLEHDFEVVAEKFLVMLEVTSPELAAAAEFNKILDTFAIVVKVCLQNGELHPKVTAVLWKHYNKLVRKFGPYFSTASIHILIEAVAMLCKDGIESILHSFEVDATNNSSRFKCLIFFQQKLAVTILTFACTVVEKLAMESIQLLICSFGVFKWFRETSTVNTTRKLFMEIIGKVKLHSDWRGMNIDQNLEKLIILSQSLTSNYFNERDWVIFYKCGVQLILEDFMETMESGLQNYNIENFMFCIDMYIEQCTAFVHLSNNFVDEDLYLSSIYSISSRVAKSMLVYSNAAILDTILLNSLGCESSTRNEIWIYSYQIILSLIFLHFDKPTQQVFLRRILNTINIISYSPMLLVERNKFIKNCNKLVSMLLAIEDLHAVFDEFIMFFECALPKRSCKLYAMQVDLTEAMCTTFFTTTHFNQRQSVLLKNLREEILTFVQKHTDLTKIWSLQFLSAPLKIISCTSNCLQPTICQNRPVATILLKVLQALCRQLESYATLSTMEEFSIWKIQSILKSIHTCIAILTSQDITNAVSLLLNQLFTCCNYCIKAIFTNVQVACYECLLNLILCYVDIVKPFIQLNADMVHICVETLETIRKASLNFPKRWTLDWRLMDILRQFKETVESIKLEELSNRVEKSFSILKNSGVSNKTNSHKELLMHRWLSNQTQQNK